MESAIRWCGAAAIGALAPAAVEDGDGRDGIGTITKPLTTRER
jgi:hypothetical protein